MFDVWCHRNFKWCKGNHTVTSNSVHWSATLMVASQCISTICSWWFSFLGKISEESHAQNKSFSFSEVFLASLFHSLFSFLPSLHSFFALLSVLDLDCIPFQPFSKRLPSAFGLIFSGAWLYLCSYIAMHCKNYVRMYMCGCKYILLSFFSLCDKVISI